MFQAWVLAIVCVLTTLGPLEAAKGSLRAGVLSRGGMRRSKNRNYGHDLDWDQRGEGKVQSPLRMVIMSSPTRSWLRIIQEEGGGHA